MVAVICSEPWSAMPVQLMCRGDCPVWSNGSALSCGEQCTVCQRLTDTLSLKFHHSSFRPGQLEALLAVAHGKDVFVRMPTGGGKSMCMFLIPLCLGGDSLGVIISPLIGLIEQQVSCFIEGIYNSQSCCMSCI